MDMIVGASRYILPLITLVILAKCVMALLFGHPREKTYGYMIDTLDGERLPLNMWETSIGRSSSCDIVIGYETVSRVQAVISRRIDGWYIYDLRSKAGVLVNEKLIDKKALITDGDILGFGYARYRFKVADDPVSLVGKKKAKRKAQSLHETARSNAEPLADSNAQPFADRYYDDEYRPTLHFERQGDAAYRGALSPELDRRDVFSSRPDRRTDEQPLAHPSAPRRVAPTHPSLVDAKTGEIFILSGNHVTIGRSNNADIVLSSPGVSRKHAQLILYEDGWAIADCSSASGTFLSGERVTQPQLLFNGDRLDIGDVTLYYSTLTSFGGGGEPQ